MAGSMAHMAKTLLELRPRVRVARFVFSCPYLFSSCEADNLYQWCVPPVVCRASALLSLKNWQSITVSLQCWRPK